MAGLRERLEVARAEVARLEREAASLGCRDAGHQWVFDGGRWCGCHETAGCSIPVHKCARCGNYDYGDNEDARKQIAACLERFP